MSRMIRFRTLARTALAASALLLGASVSGTPAHAQTFNRPLIRPLAPTSTGPLSPGQQMQTQSFDNALSNRERAQQSLSGAGNANAALRTERRLDNQQLQQLQRP